MQKVTRSALVPYAPDQMFSLVSDIESYPGFLPWCSGARVEAERDGEVQARLEVSRGPIKKSFTTRNSHSDKRSITMSLVDGPFRHLRGHWRFDPIPESGCRIELHLEFEFATRILGRLLSPIFNEIANTMVDAFCRRAGELYGPSLSG